MSWRRKPKIVRLTEREIEALSLLAFIIEEEATNVEAHVPDAAASPISQQTVGGVPTIATMLRAIAAWIRSLIGRISMLL